MTRARGVMRFAVVVALISTTGCLRVGGGGTGGVRPGANPCRGLLGVVADGTPCPGVADADPSDCRAPLCIAGACQLDAPVLDERACGLIKIDPCRRSRCVPKEGTCQESPVADGTSCGAGAGPAGDCRRMGCQGGRCVSTPDSSDLPVAAGPLADPSVVEVSAHPSRVEERTAWTDCCWLCEEQWLEALSPTPAGPSRTAPGGGLPERQTFCGEVRRYGINDELADPRDIMLNIAPRAPAFRKFVAGFRNTECTPLSGADKTRLAVADNKCDEAACTAAVAAWDAQPEGPSHEARCIHAEITPADQLYGEDDLFLPISGSGTCGGSWDCASQLEPATPAARGKDVCVHGVYLIDHGPDHGDGDHKKLCCSPDASHDRPEIHPIDAIWFRAPDDKGWVFGVLQDDSNRYSFPHCDDDHNGNNWSGAPRDMTFRFPFRLPPSELPACVRLRPLTSRKGGAPHLVLGLNVTTAGQAPLFVEEKALLRDPVRNVPPRVEVREEAGFEAQTQVRIEGCGTPDATAGFITVRVAVGCDGRHGDCGAARLAALDPAGRHDAGDAGSGYYLGELHIDKGPCDGQGGRGVLTQ